MKLLEFPHSHFCEIARWALDYKGLDFDPVPVMPGLHLYTIKRLAPRSSVPVLIATDQVTQGSSEILNYLEDKFPLPSLDPEDEANRERCRTLERNMHSRLGENIRRILYRYLLSDPEFITYCFTHSMPRSKQLIVRFFYPVLKRKIYQTYVINDEIVAQAMIDFNDAMQEIAEMLNGNAYLVGGAFSRADLTVASMLSLLVTPPEHPFPWPHMPDGEATDFMMAYSSHPVTRWAKMIYRKHRLRSPRTSGDNPAVITRSDV